MAGELVAVPKMSGRAGRFYKALTPFLGAPVAYTGGQEWIYLWGPGGEYQHDILKKHRAQGGQVVMFDIGYWQRSEDAVRLTFNGFHPPNYLHIGMRLKPRFSLLQLDCTNLYCPTGHILVCGTGAKSKALYGSSADSWGERAVSYARSRWPDREIVYRPKPGSVDSVAGATSGKGGTIEDWLTNCAHVLVQHSNVQVDCLRHGIPCSMEDGILMGNNWGTRDELLEAVSWFNWLPSEAEQMLLWIEENKQKIVDTSRAYSYTAGFGGC